MIFCPLGMVEGNMMECREECAYCPPKEMYRLANSMDSVVYLINETPDRPLCVSVDRVAYALETVAECMPPSAETEEHD